MVGIYCIRNKVDDKRYVGKSININDRFIKHRYYLNKSEYDSKHCNIHLYNAVKKYGLEYFSFEIIETFENINEQLLMDRELYWIDFYNTTNRKSGYNLRKDSSTKCIVHEETKIKQSLNNRGEGNPNFGNKWSNEQKIKMLDIAKERHAKGVYGDEWKSKISKKSSELWSDLNKRRDMAEKVSKSKTKYTILQYTMNNELVSKYESVKDVISKNPDYKWQNIYSVCNGYKKSYKGYIWIKELKI